MKREIKFRAWDNSNQRMEYNVAILLLWENAVWPHTTDYYHSTQQWTDEDGMIYNPELMQFTGLKDKNGKEIYEGDIVKYNGFYEGDHFEEGGIAYITWDEEGHSVCFDDKIGQMLYLCSTWDLAKNHGGEVIGNIYENPELLTNN